jgi:DNA-binding Lrp family transcriptional regulator
MEYRCTFRAEKHGPDLTFTLCVRVPVKSLCPCSKAISDRGAHNQRSLVDVEVRSEGHVWIEQVVEAVEACGSAPLFALLKREDEKYVTELAYDNPKFVEDLVRDVVLRMRAIPGVTWLRVAAENQESIHNHSAFAEILWSREDVGGGAPGGADRLPGQDAAAAAPPFGAWLRQAREQRRYTQAELAGRIGVSTTVLSRVEHGEKRLSEDALDRLAEAWGEDPERLRLRAGHLPAELAGRIAADPEGFLRWARG